MDRRKFISSTLSVGALGVSTTAAGSSDIRLFGTPDSIKGSASVSAATQLTISIARLGFSTEATAQMASVATLWSDILNSPSNRAAYSDNPKVYLESAGFFDIDPGSDRDFQILAACCDERALAACDERNYEYFFSLIKERGLKVSFKSEMSSRINEVFERDRERFEAYFSEVSEELISNEEKISDLLSDSDIKSLVGAFSTSQQKACTLVIVCVSAVTVSIATLVAAAAAIAVVATFMVQIKTMTSGDEAKSGSLNQIVNRLQSYNPDLLDTYRAITHIEGMTGSKGASMEFLRQMIEDETSVVFDAAVNSGFISISKEHYQETLRIAKNCALRAAGLRN